jgi:hypothetical protein
MLEIVPDTLTVSLSTTKTWPSAAMSRTAVIWSLFESDGWDRTSAIIAATEKQFKQLDDVI